MIVDSIDNIMLYAPLLNNLKEGVEAVKALPNLEEGRYEFEGGWFMVQKGETKPFSEGTFEAHRKYVDVQIVLAGAEEIAWNEINSLNSCKEYDSVKDAERFNGAFTHTMYIDEGMFYIAFPHDGHKAVSHSDRQHSYTKVVMKLPVRVE